MPTGAYRNIHLTYLNNPSTVKKLKSTTLGQTSSPLVLLTARLCRDGSCLQALRGNENLANKKPYEFKELIKQHAV